MHITGKESTNAQENCERKPKKKRTREREREREMEGVQGNLCRLGTRGVRWLLSASFLTPVNMAFCLGRSSLNSLRQRFFKLSQKLLLALPFRLETWGMNPVSELLRWRDFDIKTWGWTGSVVELERFWHLVGANFWQSLNSHFSFFLFLCTFLESVVCRVFSEMDQKFGIPTF